MQNNQFELKKITLRANNNSRYNKQTVCSAGKRG